MEKLRDLSLQIDVPLLDATVAAFYGTGSKEERNAVDQILRELQNNPDMWLQVVHILSSTHNLNTKFFTLQADICQMGMDQMEVNVIAREYCDKMERKNKPIILSQRCAPCITLLPCANMVPYLNEVNYFEMQI